MNARAIRLRAVPKRHNKLKVQVFVPVNKHWHLAGSLDLPETVWHYLLYPLLTAGATRCGVTLTLET